MSETGLDIYSERIVRDIGGFVYRMHIADRYFVNFADASPVLIPSPCVCYGYGKRIGDAGLQALGAWAA